MNKIGDVNVAIIGLGTVGSSLVKILQNNKDIITARTGKNIIPKIGISRTNKNLGIPFSNNINDAFSDDIDIVVELIGGIDIAYEIALKTLEHKKPLVTANKAMLAHYRYELEKKKGIIGFEASVCGAIPIIKVLRDSLCANNILKLQGILNGTCNYILSKMSHQVKNNLECNFQDILKEAQNLGYAEADPTLDINGVDSAHKLLIICSLAYGANIKLENIIIDGIDKVIKEDIIFAHEFGYEIKLLGIAKKDQNNLEVGVRLCMIPNDSMLSKVDSAMNAINISGDMIGKSLYYGAGAGGLETASSVVSDIIEIARCRDFSMFGYLNDIKDNLILTNEEDIRSCYYIRLCVKDKVGVLKLVSNILYEKQISVKSLSQKNLSYKKDCVLLFLSTHECCEIQIKNALREFTKLDEVLKEPFMIRIQEP